MNRGLLRHEAVADEQVGPEWGFPYPQPGCWLEPPVWGVKTTNAPALNTAYLHPFCLPVKTSFDRVCFEVTTAAASGTALLWVYSDSGSLMPHRLVYAGPAGSTAAIAAVQTNVEDLTLPRGIWWVGLSFVTAAPSLRCYQGGSLLPITTKSVSEITASGHASYTITPGRTTVDERDILNTFSLSFVLGLRVVGA